MYTQCPHCHGIYRVEAAQLAAASGRVRCGRCDAEFDALRSLRDELPQSRDTESAELPLGEPPAEDGPEDGSVPAAEVGAEGSESEVPFASEDFADNADEESENGPERPRDSVFAMPVAGTRQTSALMRHFWTAGCVVLACVLLAQFLVLAPRGMAQNPELRPTAQALCRIAGCKVPPREDLNRLRLASRDVRAHPSVPGALIISATLVNEADFAQPFPVLEIALADLQGQPVAMRRFRPGEYLPDQVRVADGMAAGSVTRVSLEVVDPGEQAVAFEFAFRRDA